MASSWSPEAYLAAARYAAEAHQMAPACVPGTDLPYFYHVCLVAMETTGCLAAEGGHDGNLAVQCALLHDVLEDTPVTAAALGRRFGPAVCEGVQALSKDGAITDAADRMRDSLSRIRRQPPAVWLVKLADRITNLQPPPSGWPAGKVVRYRAESVDILQRLGDASPYLARRLQLKIDGYGQGG